MRAVLSYTRSVQVLAALKLQRPDQVQPLRPDDEGAAGRCHQASRARLSPLGCDEPLPQRGLRGRLYDILGEHDPSRPAQNELSAENDLAARAEHRRLDKEAETQRAWPAPVEEPTGP